jgi:arsenate reductase (thioredoxin)
VSEQNSEPLFQRSLDSVVDRYATKYSGVFARETIDRVVYESYASLLRTAKNTAYLTTLTEKFAGDRLRALFVSQDGSRKEAPEVLFVCVQNAGRSQMAMAFMEEMAKGKIVVRSAGSMPASEVSSKTVEVMAELGISLQEAFPKPLTDDVVRAADVVITMGCGDACPLYPGKRYLDWQLEDPADLDLDGVRRVRDEIRDRVKALVAELI